MHNDHARAVPEQMCSCAMEAHRAGTCPRWARPRRVHPSVLRVRRRHAPTCSSPQQEGPAALLDGPHSSVTLCARRPCTPCARVWGSDSSALDFDRLSRKQNRRNDWNTRCARETSHDLFARVSTRARASARMCVCGRMCAKIPLCSHQLQHAPPERASLGRFLSPASLPASQFERLLLHAAVLELLLVERFDLDGRHERK